MNQVDKGSAVCVGDVSKCEINSQLTKPSY